MNALKTLFASLALFLSMSVFAAVDINSADAKSLEKLPGIGPAKAQAIVDYRAKNGVFKTKEDLKKVEGIGDKTYQTLQNEISVGGPAK
jgi:competence protein ComEA